MAELLDCNLPNRVSGDNLADVMQLWREGLITNWDYLTQLNKVFHLPPSAFIYFLFSILKKISFLFYRWLGGLSTT